MPFLQALFDEITKKAAIWMLNRGWKKLTAKRRQGVYPEQSRRKQSLFEHTMVELDSLLSLLPVLRQSNHFYLTKEEEKILTASVFTHDVEKEKPEWQERERWRKRTLEFPLSG